MTRRRIALLLLTLGMTGAVEACGGAGLPAASPAPSITPTTTKEAASEDPSQARVSISGVEVTEEYVAVRGEATLPDGSCVSAELWADGRPAGWWPADVCAPVQEGEWRLLVPLDVDQALKSDVQYMVRAYQPGGPQVVATFPFDLDAPPSPGLGGDPTLILPESAVPIQRASVDLNGDGKREEVILTGWGGAPDRLGYDFLQLFVITTDTDGEYVVAWRSEQLPTDRGEALQSKDINADGLPELLSKQAVGASGERLYVLSWYQEAYGWLPPRGGEFDGEDAFGETGARVEDRDGDGLYEILGSYGPASRLSDVYVWDGEAYIYEETLEEAQGTYRREEVVDVGLSLEVPADWMEIEPGIWAAPERDALRLGVKSIVQEPSQEPEAGLLPEPSQILESKPVELEWGSGRRVLLEVYGEAPAAGGLAPVTSVEMHVLALLEQGTGRQAIDIYISAPKAEDLVALEPVLDRALESVVLRVMTCIKGDEH